MSSAWRRAMASVGSIAKKKTKETDTETAATNDRGGNGG